MSQMTMREKNDFAEKNLNLVHFVTNEFNYSSFSYEDRFQTACVGLTKALNTYVPGKSKLTTYAVVCMRNELAMMVPELPHGSSQGVPSLDMVSTFQALTTGVGNGCLCFNIM